MNIMKKGLPLLAVLVAGTVVWAASLERYLHVRVTNPTTHELVRVNVPLSLAEKVIPAINHGELHDGKIRIGNFTADNVNVKVILDALKTAPEGEFVTVRNPATMSGLRRNTASWLSTLLTRKARKTWMLRFPGMWRRPSFPTL